MSSGSSATLGVPLDRNHLCVRAFERLHPAGRRARLERRRDRGRPLRRGPHVRAGRPAFEHAVELEGHPDNVGAALLGGFVICAADGELVRFDPAPGLEERSRSEAPHSAVRRMTFSPGGADVRAL